MSDAPFNYLDAALLAVCFISGLLAMYRGFAREMLSIVSWIAAAGVGAWIVFTKKELSADVSAQTGLPPQIALAVVAVVVALIVLIVVHLITARISDAILDSRVGMVDRIFGFLFGVARGFILLVIPYMFYEAFQPDENAHLPWIRNAQSLPYIKSAGGTIRSILVQYAPSTLTNPQSTPPAEGEQGWLNHEGRILALAIEDKRYYIVVEPRG